MANGLGWGFDGMDSMVFSLVSPLVITEFALDLPSYRSGVQIALFVGIAGLYFWPWLADRYGRRSLLAINIALFSLLMPVVALAPSFAAFLGDDIVQPSGEDAYAYARFAFLPFMRSLAETAGAMKVADGFEPGAVIVRGHPHYFLLQERESHGPG